MEELGSPSSAQPPTMTLDGADQDSALSNSKVLSRQEVLKRRHRRTNQLYGFYRAQYWALMEEVKVKYKEYYWTYGKSPFMEDHKNNQPNHTEGNAPSAENVSNCNGNDKVTVGSNGSLHDVVRCAFSGCKSKAMALTSLPTGPSICNKPILRSMVPPECPSHCQLGERCLIRVLRRAGCAIPTHRKPNLKFRALLSEFVNRIRKKRKNALKALVLKAETE